MRPLTLTVQGLRSFRAPVTIDFTGREHVAIIGDTGAGKSSILEAITYALYGETTFAAQVNQELMNDTSTTLRVVLRFKVSGEEWEVARALRKAAGGRVGGAKAQLRRLDKDGGTLEQVEQVKPVNGRIEKLIGLDSTAFLRTIVLPQGRFARLLAEDTPAVRATVLRQVWPTEELEEAGRLVGTVRARTTELRQQLEHAGSQYPDDPAAHLAQLTADLELAQETARAASIEKAAAETAHRTLQAALRERAAATEVVERLRTAVLERAVEQIAPIAAREREIAARDTALVQRQTETADRLAKAPADTDGPGVAEVSSALATLPAIGSRVTAAETAAEEARRSAEAAGQAAAHATRTAELAAAAGERTARHAAQRPPLAEAAETAKDQLATVKQLYADCTAHRKALDDARDALAARRKERAACAERLDTASAEAQRNETSVTAANERLRTAERASEDDAQTRAREKQRLSDARATADKRRLLVAQRYDECRNRAQAAQEWEQKLTGRRRQHDTLTESLEAAVAEERKAERRRQNADKRLAALQRSDSAAAAARDLHVGDACPVCQRELPADWTAPAGADLQKAATAAERAGRAADAAGNRTVELTTERNGVATRIDEAATQADTARAAFNSALQALSEDADIDLQSELPARDALLDPLDTALRVADDALDRHERDQAARVKALAQRKQEAAAACEAARRVAAASGRRTAALTADLAGLDRQIDEAGDRADAATRALAAGLQALSEAAGTSLAAPLPDRDALPDRFEAAVRETSEALARHEQEHETLQAESNDSATAAAAAAEAATGKNNLAAARRNAAEQALAQAREAIRAVPAPFRPSLDLPADHADLQAVDTTSVEESMASARQREQVLEARATERDGLQKELAAIRDERDALDHRNAAEVQAPIHAIVENLNEHRAVLMKAIWDLELDEDLPAAVAPHYTEALRAGIEAQRKTTANAARAADARANAAAARADTARTGLATIAARLADDVNADDPDAIVEAATAAATEAGYHERRRENEVRQFAAIVDDIEDLRALHKEAVDKELALTDLENALKPGAFPKWLTLRRSRELLVHASRMLGTMSGGRYAFVDPQDTDAQWRVLDSDSGQARSPASLSGGEQFIASLSLALGMVEMMARSGGRLESLFLDEGFGSLDRNNLDTAVEALGAVATGGRMVGVISHVRAVAEQIEHVLAVTRHATGSQVEWLADTERRQLAESDDGLYAADAMAGLLE